MASVDEGSGDDDDERDAMCRREVRSSSVKTFRVPCVLKGVNVYVYVFDCGLRGSNMDGCFGFTISPSSIAPPARARETRTVVRCFNAISNPSPRR